jgi:hypothetical protein
LKALATSRYILILLLALAAVGCATGSKFTIGEDGRLHSADSAVGGSPGGTSLSDPKNAKVPDRGVLVELLPSGSEEADHYEVQIRPSGGKVDEPLTVKAKPGELQVRARVFPGQYLARTRSLDKQEVPGPWGRWHAFTVVYKSLAAVSPPDGAEIAPMTSVHESVTFEWPKIFNAKEYFFILKNGKDEVIKSIRTKKTWQSEPVDFEAEYSWAVVPIMEGEETTAEMIIGNPYEYHFNKFKILKPDPELREITMNVKTAPIIDHYKFEITRLSSKGEKLAPVIRESRLADFAVGLLPGVYELRVQSVFLDDSVSDWSPASSIFIPYQPTQGRLPGDKEKIDPVNDLDNPITLTWKPGRDAAFYMVYVYRKKDDYLLIVQKAEEATTIVHLAHEEEYTWKVIPYGFGEPVRDPPKEGNRRFSIDHYIPLLLSAPEEPSQLYGWGRYWVSNSNYLGKNYDENSIVNQPMYAGSLEGALGYWHRKSSYGVMAHAGYSGFLLDRVYSYNNAGINFGKRYILQDEARLRYWGGVSYVEMPEIIRNAATQTFKYHQLKSYGPQFQVSYLRNFPSSINYGWQAYGIIYYSAFPIGSPNSLRQVPQFSYTAGLTMTGRWDDDSKWAIGYAYRLEAGRYGTTDRNLIDNTSQISGHYLHLSYEFGLAKPEK